MLICVFFFNVTATTEIYTLHIVGSVRCVQETGYQRRVHGKKIYKYKQIFYFFIFCIMVFVLPWWIRMGVDVTLFFIPYYLLTNYPTTIFYPLQNIRRLRRRKQFSDIEIKLNPKFSIEEAKEFKKKIRLQD
eukprot:TRINITY_DN14501_c0_g1_i2.p2 TRINITY_DN14501_c0_g1~~TRINITY_DN14501_c0_g1_i2.p2  ORF type:complete len:132 (+),score=42.51 TRINITY_DN14501_c0_g1_i2:90-485(+)